MGTSSQWGRLIRRVLKSLDALRYSFTFLTNNWRRAAADDASAGLT